MDYQADYFRQYGLNRYFMLADNVKHPLMNIWEFS